MNDHQAAKSAEHGAKPVAPGILPAAPACSPDGYEHCITCSDEALQARVLRVDQEAGLALVAALGTTADVDISLLDDVAPDDIVLIHGGIAIGKVSIPTDQRI